MMHHSILLLFSFLASQFVSSLYDDQSVFNRVCHQFQIVSQIYRSKEARIRKRCRKIYTTHDGELIIFLSHTHAFPLSLSPSLSQFEIQHIYTLFIFILSSSRSHIKKALGQCKWKMKTGLIQFLLAIASRSAANIVQSNTIAMLIKSHIKESSLHVHL